MAIDLFDSAYPEMEPLIIDDEVKEAEFKVATREALENNAEEFDFYGYVIEVSIAVEVVTEMNSLRTYH